MSGLKNPRYQVRGVLRMHEFTELTQKLVRKSQKSDILHHSQEPSVGCVRRSRNAPLSLEKGGLRCR
jgi:hypothetical protein